MSDYINIECLSLCKQYRFRIEDANFAKGYIPNKILLDRTRNIHSYIVFCRIENGLLSSEYWNSDDFAVSIRALLSTQYSNLDRPLFFLFRDKNNILKSIEGTELRLALLNNPSLDINRYIIDNSISFNQLAICLSSEL